MRSAFALAVLALFATLPAAAQGRDDRPARDDARPRDLQRLQQELTNLDEELQALDLEPARAQAFRERADEIREDVVYLKVRMRRHQQGGHEGTGVSYAEVTEVREAVVQLREDMHRAARRSGDIRLPEGTQLLVRLDEPLSSRVNRREDRFDASLYRPVRGERGVALPAGTKVRGIVKDVQPAERPSREARLDLDFDVVYVDAMRVDMRSTVLAVGDGSDSNLDTKERAGIGAVLGGVIGGILGGKKGAVIGVVLGGAGAVVGTKGEDVELPEGTIVTIRLTKPLEIRR